MERRSHCVPSLLLMAATTTMAAACGSGGDADGAAVPLYREFLTLEVSIADDPDGMEVQLVRPQHVSADAAGSIYVADEQWVSVFGPDGTPLRRIGREGSGPGEFMGASSVQVGPTGYIAAVDVLWAANIYAPDGGFIRRSQYRNERPSRDYLQGRGLTFSMLNDVLALGPDRLLIDLHGLDMKLPGPFVSTSQLLYTTPDTLLELCRYVNRGQIRTGPTQTRGIQLQGSLLWSMLDDGRVLYTETGTDRVMDGDPSLYLLMVVDPTSLGADTLAVPWTPRRLPAAVRHADSLYVGAVGRSYEIDPAAREVMADTEHFPPLKALRSDRGIAFGFHYSSADTTLSVLDEDLESAPHVADMVEIATGRLLARAEFPFLPEVIRGGRAYHLHRPAEGYPAVYVYRIDPRLYARAGGMAPPTP